VENRFAEQDAENHKHTFSFEYQLRSMQPANGYRAVFAERDLDSGGCKLVSRELQFLATATRITREYCDTDLYDKIRDTTIVGVEIINGQPVIVNEHEAFAGLMPPDADMESCIGSLSMEFFEKLPKHVQEKSEVQFKYPGFL